MDSSRGAEFMDSSRGADLSKVVANLSRSLQRIPNNELLELSASSLR